MFEYTPEEMRRWAYVLWDAGRLEEHGGGCVLERPRDERWDRDLRDDLCLGVSMYVNTETSICAYMCICLALSVRVPTYQCHSLHGHSILLVTGWILRQKDTRR